MSVTDDCSREAEYQLKINFFSDDLCQDVEHLTLFQFKKNQSSDESARSFDELIAFSKLSELFSVWRKG